MAVSINEINKEYCLSLTTCIIEYIEEANRRLRCYKESKAALDKEVYNMKAELNTLKEERAKQGFFAFSKKKELDLVIDRKNKQIAEYERTHKSKELWNEFERMYS